MRFTLLFPLALFAGFAVAAGPVPREELVTVTDLGTDAKPAWDPTDAGPASHEPAVAARDVSTRDEYNPLDEERDSGSDAILIVCTGNRCNGKCFGFDLKRLPFRKCFFAPKPFHSVIIRARRKPDFDVFVANGRCRGTFPFSTLNVC